MLSEKDTEILNKNIYISWFTHALSTVLSSHGSIHKFSIFRYRFKVIMEHYVLWNPIDINLPVTDTSASQEIKVYGTLFNCSSGMRL